MGYLPAKERRKTILTLGLPIIAGMLSQNVLNVVDAAMVGTLGNVALAATGLGGFANFMATSFIMGLSAGVQAVSSRRLGEGKRDVLAVALNAGLIFAFIWAIPWTALLHWGAPAIFSILIDDPAVAAEGVPYFQARLLSALAVGINSAFRGYWNGINLPKLYMRTLMVSHITNLFLNWVLIFGNLGAPEMGTLGAGIASTIATYVAALTYIGLGIQQAKKNGFLTIRPDRATCRNLLRLTLPASFAQLSLATGYTALMWIVGQTGTASLAAANVLLTVTLVIILPGIAFGLVAASMVGQALGRNDPEDAAQWGWDVVRVAVVALGLMGLPMILVPDLLLSGFLHDPTTRELAVLPLQLVGATISLDAIGLVLLNALYGAGASRSVLIVGTTMQWGLGLPLAYLFGPILGWGLAWMWAAMILYRVGQSLILALMWKKRSWVNIAV
jgi:MATE family multidrug resistance protein